MPKSYNSALLFGAGLSVVAALLHVACIIGGPAWYRFFGASQRTIEAAVLGSWYAPLVTLAVALVLLVWAAYALSAADVLPSLPLLKIGIVTITAVYLLRGLQVFQVLVFSPSQLTPFVVWSSLICLGYAAVHLLGVVQVWHRL